MKEQTDWSNRQLLHKLAFAIFLILCSSVATMVADGRILACYPKLQDKKPQLDLTISSDAVSGMGNPNDPVKFTVKLINSGDEKVNGILA